jgi:type VI secretion system secreted protein Hcp
MAAVDYFLKIDGIKGESQDDKHKDEIQVESWSFGLTQTGSFGQGGGGGAGKASFQDLHISSKTNAASPKLFIATATGEHIKQAILTCRKAGGKQEEFLVITLSDILVSSYQTGGHGASGELPMDQFALNFAKIEYAYKVQDAKGGLGAAIKAGYDLKKSVKV